MNDVKNLDAFEKSSSCLCKFLEKNLEDFGEPIKLVGMRTLRLERINQSEKFINLIDDLILQLNDLKDGFEAWSYEAREI